MGDELLPDHLFGDILLNLFDDNPYSDLADLPHHSSVSVDNALSLPSAAQPFTVPISPYEAPCIQPPPLSASEELYLSTLSPSTITDRLLIDAQQRMSFLTREAEFDSASTRDDGAARRASYTSEFDTSDAGASFQAPPGDVALSYHIEQPHCEVDELLQVIQWARTFPLDLTGSLDMPDVGELQQQFGKPRSSTSNEAGAEDGSHPEIRNPGTFVAASTEKRKEERIHCQDKSKEKLSSVKQPKKERRPKLVFRTRSDVETIDDGFKWRKYGQKARKNSPFPRSYYKCTYTHCRVKKYVEREADESSYVLTTYEGLHNHAAGQNEIPMVYATLCNAAPVFTLCQPIQTDFSHRSDHISQLQQIAQLQVNSDKRRDEGLLDDVIPLELRRGST